MISSQRIASAMDEAFIATAKQVCSSSCGLNRIIAFLENDPAIRFQEPTSDEIMAMVWLSSQRSKCLTRRRLYAGGCPFIARAYEERMLVDESQVDDLPF